MRYVALDGWRGVAALAVALLHLNFASHFYDVPAIRGAGLFVDLFFVLSGFVMAHTYGARLDGAGVARTFMIKRFGRVYPLHLATLAFLVALELAKLGAVFALGVSPGEPPFTGESDLAALGANLFLVQSIGTVAPWTWNGPSWSISVEFWTYLIFAACVVAVGARRLTGYALTAVAAFVLYYATRNGLVLPLGHSMFECVFAFFVGAVLYEIAPRGAPVSSRFATVLEAVAVAGLIGLLSSRSAYHVYLAPIYFAALLWVFASEQGAISRLLKTSPLLRLGEYSYSIYMIHYPLLIALSAALRAAEQVTGAPLLEPRMEAGATHDMLALGGPWVQDVLTLVYLGVVIGMASLTYRFIEAPARDWFNAFAARRESKRPTATAL